MVSYVAILDSLSDFWEQEKSNYKAKQNWEERCGPVEERNSLL